jgi:hypothetical protein
MEGGLKKTIVPVVMMCVLMLAGGTILAVFRSGPSIIGTIVFHRLGGIALICVAMIIVMWVLSFLLSCFLTLAAPRKPKRKP